ncbi:MAG: peptide chain release factor N(5)-glutamine methyltransferase [Lachnospiraceae bacterium]|nr:peptide chain release factor N(5)-glutamine methyltransferase [Lachnospiraceae bacterium]
MYSANGPVRSMKDWLEYGIGFLEAHQIEDAKTDAWLLMEYTANINKSYYYMNMHEPMDAGDAEDYALLIHRRAEHIPVQYLIGEAWFYGRSFRVNESVLIPRQDTEILVEEALKRIRPGMHVLDLCTGSGCMAWTVALDYPSPTVCAVDSSPDALAIARSQFDGQPSGSGLPPEWLTLDVLDSSSIPDRQFDVILANPPYVLDSQRKDMRPNVLDWEPQSAIFVSGPVATSSSSPSYFNAAL